MLTTVYAVLVRMVGLAVILPRATNAAASRDIPAGNARKVCAKMIVLFKEEWAIFEILKFQPGTEA